ncbi:DHH family phosphoesterase [Pseudomaricurvus alkylphenolicus]|uniref:DHH family phosphoesterase n=1 Tax=Pseudomaricurvus alkylphenolicus TaxID=1306991 RepID=UPI001421D6A5|nr:DHH family phosphoesterase [Pseudomaricurvus alkylphenolicus]NIB37951.1 DHH family phosphoesterase [Pseudomaricurvus alkylphenolicus]
MADYDVFNGDADGICALIQLRNSEPSDAQLVTGVKRDISLLKRVEAGPGDSVTVLDISMDKNSQDLGRILEAGASVFYADHHFPGEIPDSGNLTALINEAPDTCTSILVNKHLKGEFLGWAVVGAFGDNLKKSAEALAAGLQLSAEDLQALENLGIYINYNGYGSDLEDLHFKPADLYQKLLPYKNPLDFIRDGNPDFQKLEQGYLEDMAAAADTQPHASTDNSAAFILPNEKWARRVSGVYSNDLANRNPDRAHAVLTEKSNGNYLVSVRAPINNKTGAVDLCRQFPTGGGRAAAAGINDLPADMLPQLIDALEKQYGG